MSHGYSNRFVLSVLVNGQIQKPLANGEVHVPFGEYSVRLKSKNDRRAVCDLHIDGESVGAFVVESGGTFDVHRWANKDAAFTFVDLESPEAYGEGKGGANPTKEKGLINASFKLEKLKPDTAGHVNHYHTHIRHYPWYNYGIPSNYGIMPNYGIPSNYGFTGAVGVAGNSVVGGACRGLSSLSNSAKSFAMNSSVGCSMDYMTLDSRNTLSTNLNVSGMTNPPVSEGCTVEGGLTGQKFRTVHFDTEDSSTVITLFLKGYVPQKLPQSVQKENVDPILIPKTIPSPSVEGGSNFCQECGTPRAGAKFCRNCGNKY